jgi:hypothetical protein
MATTLVDSDNQGTVDNTYVNLVTYNGSGSCGGDDLLGTCTANALVPGFVSECSTSRLAYDLSPENHGDQPFSGTAYSSQIEWEVTKPDTFNLTVIAKPTSDCVGEYIVRHCTFRAAQMWYPVELFPLSQLGPNSPVRSYISPGQNCLSLNANSSFRDDTFVSYLPAQSELESPNSTFGGLVHYLQITYNAELTWHWNGSVWSVNATGKQAENAILDSFALSSGVESWYGNHSLASPDYCRNTVYNVVDEYDTVIVEFALHDRIRNLMFLSSVLEFAYDTTESVSSQQVPAARSAPVLRYRVIYRYWAGSLAVTSAIILMITPTFWGFWRLRGKVTLSPVDTAIALEAPLVQTDKELVDARSRLKEIGERPLYSASRHDGGPSAWVPT